MTKKKKEKIEYQKPEGLTALAIDSHAHITPSLGAKEIIRTMKEDGLKKIVIMTSSKEGAKWASEFCKNNKGVFYMLGLHPYDIRQFNDEFVEFVKSLKLSDKNFVGLGEIGLDYHPHENMATPEFQKRVFCEQIKLAYSLNLPISVHIRDAHDDAIELLKQNKKYLKFGGIIHCCSANAEEVQKYLALGFHISFSGAITYTKKSEQNYLEETIKQVPLEKLLIETDSPYLCPAPYRGRTNEPKYVLITAMRISEILNIDINKLVDQTTSNAEKLLKI